MHKLTDMIHIDKRFQTSINLELDLNNPEKIASYIPTVSSVDVLNEYAGHIVENRNKANILIGPYGKGKSHLLLVFMALISGNKEVFEKVIGKIKANKLNKTSNIELLKGKKFLPVIISGTYEDLNRGFIEGLREALKREGLNDIVPETYYTKAYECIREWKENYKDTYRAFVGKLRKNNYEIGEFLKKLSRENKEAMDLFEKIYPMLTSGSRFNPIYETLAIKLYSDIKEKLVRIKGYSGIYVIFDEFSKYVEGHRQDTFSRDMKILQDMCELAQKNEEYQLHITFVAHKSIKEYGKDMPEEMINAFMGVEGRLKEERFVVFPVNNYEIIGHVVSKSKKEYESFLKENDTFKEIIEKSYNTPYFQSNFTMEEYMKIVAWGSFPLLPLTSYCLFNISAKVAQNERSVFTFLANDEHGSLINLLDKNEMLGVDVVYDYFENLFRENKGMPEIHNEWLQADYALNKAESKEERRIIKTLAVFRIIRKPDELPIVKEKLWLASGLNRESFNKTVDKLEKKGLIIFRIKMGTYAFKHNVGVDIEKEIEKVVNSFTGKVNIPKEIEKISELDFALPKQYNQKFTMTRFFRYVFMSPEQFQKVTKAEYLFEEYRADGIIVAIVNAGEDDTEKIIHQVNKLNDKRIVVIYPENRFVQDKNIRKLLAVKQLIKNDRFIEDNQVLLSELKLYEEDLIFEINSFLEKSYMPENGECRIFYCEPLPEIKSERAFNRFLSGICSSYYNMAPKINNELINRTNVSAQIKKARQKIIDNILNNDDCIGYNKGTSPEATIFRATVVHTGLLKNNNEKTVDKGVELINKEIDGFIMKSAGEKVSFKELYDVLEGESFGVRRGVIPIYLARKFMAMEDMPVVYLSDKEIEITSNVFENINLNPDKYFLYTEKESLEKEKYLKAVENIFHMDNVSGQNRLGNIVAKIQEWYRNLPQITINTKRNCVGREYYRFRNLFRNIELNPRDILFEEVLNILGGEEKSFEACIVKMKKIVEYLNSFALREKEDVVRNIKKIWSVAPGESLAPCLKGWYKTIENNAFKQVWNENTSGFINVIRDLDINDELEIANWLAKAVSGIYIEDWNDFTKDKFLVSIEEIKNSLESFNGEEDKGESKLSFTDRNGNKVEKYYDANLDDSTGYFLKNAITEALDEFGDALETKEKLSVLMQTIEELLEG